jgi:hypothetical protein
MQSKSFVKRIVAERQAREQEKMKKLKEEEEKSKKE